MGKCLGGWDSSRTPLGELTALPRPSSWTKERGERRGRKMGERDEGKGRRDGESRRGG